MTLLSMGFYRQEYQGGLPCPPPEHTPWYHSSLWFSSTRSWYLSSITPLAFLKQGSELRVHEFILSVSSCSPCHLPQGCPEDHVIALFVEFGGLEAAHFPSLLGEFLYKASVDMPSSGLWQVFVCPMLWCLTWLSFFFKLLFYIGL